MENYFTKKELEYFRKIFLQKKFNILNEKMKIKEQEDSFLNRQTGDIVDIATNLLEKEMDMIFSETDKNNLKEIEEALARIENKTFGICIDTGEKINIERLRAIPEAKRSIKAQALYDKKQNIKKKSIGI